MSDNWIVLIPQDPTYLPDEKKVRAAEHIFASLTPEADERNTHQTEEIRFFDCGTNFEKVECPICRKEIDIDWWQDRMGDDFGRGFKLKPETLPCCGVEKNLNDLIYSYTQGFARFALEAMNPDRFEIGKEDIERLETTLDCDLRQILQHI